VRDTGARENREAHAWMLSLALESNASESIHAAND